MEKAGKSGGQVQKNTVPLTLGSLNLYPRCRKTKKKIQLY